MKILLTHLYFLEEDKAEQKIMKPYPPMGLLYIAAFAEKNNIKTEIIDNTFSNKTEFKKQLNNLNPDVLGVYLNFKTRRNFIEISKYIRNNENLKNTKIIIGGPDVKYNAEKYILHNADIVVIGKAKKLLLIL
ncbi:MAG: cobalamin B12-binding domain-containing protein [Bacteroidales bacterium]|nr:cobalamin B12-binding domain-containing protein [Bacteroidales bacterium]